jgi:patatin-related protein
MREKEIRLALVCYGGVSLAVYMHGISKEIWRVLRASRNFHDGGAPASGSQGVYRQLLEDVQAKTGVRLRVLTDILSGSSAGGINAVFLSQAIVTGQSLEPLTDLWLDNADVDALLDPDARPVGRFTKAWAAPLAWAALKQRGTLKRTVAEGAQDEMADKLSRFIRARWFEPPFGGAQLSGLLLDALEAMERGEAGPALLPDGQPLDLFITMTDFHGHPRDMTLNSPPRVTELEHRITASFSTSETGYAGLGDLAELAFAARTTSSFPGAFPPFHVGELDALLRTRGREWPSRDAFLRRILPSSYAGRAEEAVLIDGSVLSNAPFRQAMSALRNRPARREVDRRFVYIDPVPDGGGIHFGRRMAHDGGEQGPRIPGFFTTLIGATTNIPRQQPIRESLETLAGRSDRIHRMQEIGRNLRAEIDATVDDMVGKTWLLSRPTPKRLTAWRQGAQVKAAKAAGFSYSAYGHLKLTSLIDDLVRTAVRLRTGDGEDHAALRAALWHAVRARGLTNLTETRGGLVAGGKVEAGIAFFRAFDVRYRVRRLRFMVRRLAEDVESRDDVPAAAAQILHDVIFAALALYLERETAIWLGEVVAAAAAAVETQAEGFLAALQSQQSLEALDEQVDAMLCEALLALEPEPRRQMLLVYLGFPLFDIATLPLLDGEGLDEFDPIKVDRISPTDADTIRKGGAKAMLRGIEFNNFGAFFSRAYRENDYLWGRLHGADRMIDIVLSTLPPTDRPDAAQVLRYKCAAFRAILAEERPKLTRINDVFTAIEGELILCEKAAG